MRTKAAFLGVFVALLALPALGQNPANNAVRIVATVDKIDAAALVVKTDDGRMETFKLAPNVTVFANKMVTVRDIKPGDYVASAAVRGADGKLHSTEVRIFPDAMRGLGEGQRPMDQPNTMMTNATVSEVVGVGPGGTLKVKYQGGESELLVGPDVPVTAIVPSDKGMIKAGSKVQVNGTKNADGSQTAARVVIQ